MKIEFLVDHINQREKIASWFMKEWGDRYPERDLANWTEKQTYINREILPLTLVAIDNNEVVGTVCLRSDGMTTHENWKACLSYLLVPESHRGKGIGKALIKEVEVVAQKLKIDQLHSFTRLTDPKIYTCLGWNKVGKEQYRGDSVFF
jgi:predicted N-acetyltransferase YhbS